MLWRGDPNGPIMLLLLLLFSKGVCVCCWDALEFSESNCNLGQIGAADWCCAELGRESSTRGGVIPGMPRHRHIHAPAGQEPNQLLTVRPSAARLPSYYLGSSSSLQRDMSSLLGESGEEERKQVEDRVEDGVQGWRKKVEQNGCWGDRLDCYQCTVLLTDFFLSPCLALSTAGWKPNFFAQSRGPTKQLLILNPAQEPLHGNPHGPKQRILFDN